MLEGNIYDAKKTVPKKTSLMGRKAKGEIGFYASFKADEDWSSNNGLNYADKTQILNWFRETYPEWSNIWTELFENTTVPFTPRTIYCMPLDQHWEVLPNFTMLGDAAHVMPPFAGEGVNMAMLDALELSEYLHPTNYANLLEAISAYETNMRKRASFCRSERVS